jgi:serine/threonine protein kinase
MHFDGEHVPIRISDKEQVLAIGVYSVTRMLGRGAIGIVYEVVDPSGAKFALKTIEPRYLRLPESTAHRRFLQEAALLGKLNHPGIVRMHDFGMAGHPFGYPLACLVMERIDGEPLDKVMTKKRMKVPDILSLGAQVADALAYLDQNGIVHRDIKPSNLIMRLDGTVVLVDFGVARSREHTRITKERHLVGTLKYMSPERIDMTKEDDIRGDVYALGLIMYELLAQEHPFLDPQTQELVRKSEVTWPLGIRADKRVAEMCRLIEAMLIEDPDKRPTPAALRSWIRRVQKGTERFNDADDTVLEPQRQAIEQALSTTEPSGATTLPPTTRLLAAPVTSRRWLSFVAAGIGIVLGVGAGLAWVGSDRASAAYLRGEAALKLGEHRAAVSALQEAVELDDTDARAHRRLADAFLTGGDIERAREHYRRFLELEPNAPDAENVRRALEDR